MRAYLELMRPANVATALADVIAGAAIAGPGRHPGTLAWLLAATAALYAGGVVLNDFFDRRIDATERPERPIPSGRVPPGRALSLGIALLLLGMLAASQANTHAAIIGAVIAALVFAYDSVGKHLPVVGPLNMGACRGLNLLLGMAAVPSALPVYGHVALVSLIYISAITALSRGEVHGGRRVIGHGAFAAVVLVVAVLASRLVELDGAGSRLFLSGLLTVVFAARVLPPFWRAARVSSPAVIRAAVKAGVLSLVLLDAALAAVYAEPVYAFGILATAVLAFRLARVFAVT